MSCRIWKLIEQKLLILLLGAAMLFIGDAARAEQPWVVYEGHDGPGKGKKIVFVTGDEEYRFNRQAVGKIVLRVRS